MERRGWWVAAVGSLGVVLVGWVATAGDVRLWHAPRPGDGGPAPRPQPVELPPSAVEPPQPAEPGGGADLSWVFRGVLIAIGTALLAMLVWWLVTGRWRWRRPARRPRVEVPEPLPDVGSAMRDAEAELQDALRSGSPRNAIVACWVGLERAVAAAGVAPRPSETSLELTVRVLGELGVDDRSIRCLGELYREARFSEHEFTEDHRALAIDALDGIRNQLDDERSAPVAAAP